MIDHYARQYHDLYGLETIALRYFNAFGPGQMAGDYSGVISIFCDQALAGEPITVNGDGAQTRDFVCIEDIV
jgi:UDP-glucose 4-epimerase